ncbi:hypothetical protein, partial [Streptomyces sp. SM13]|uniref:hypothetical protein n=1 Tax=Streptomyces sp. SM13 TaxID=1983803 RepID=UPI0011B0907B
PLGPLLGMSALPPLYYLLLGSVLGLYAVGLTSARRRYERRHLPDAAPDQVTERQGELAGR